MNIWFATGNIHKKAELAAILNAEDSGYTVMVPADAGLDFDPEETGASFCDNAVLKARELYRLLSERRPPEFSPGDPVIADDSGLCVDALGGRPGIYSARYTGAVDAINAAAVNAAPAAADAVGAAENAAAAVNAPAAAADVVGAAGANAPQSPHVPHGKKLESSERNALLLAELGSNPRRNARFVCAMVLLFGPDRFFLAQETLEGEIVAGPESATGAGGFGYDPILYIPSMRRTVAELSEAEKNRISHRGKAVRVVAAVLKAELHCPD